MSDGIFSDCRILILPYGLPRKRISLFERQVRTNGGQIVDNIGDASPTHVVIEDDLLLDSQNAEKALKTLSVSTRESHHVVVGTRWLSTCIKKKSLQNVDEYSSKDEPSSSPRIKNDQESVSPVKIRKIESVDDVRLIYLLIYYFICFNNFHSIFIKNNFALSVCMVTIIAVARNQSKLMRGKTSNLLSEMSLTNCKNYPMVINPEEIDGDRWLIERR